MYTHIAVIHFQSKVCQIQNYYNASKIKESRKIQKCYQINLTNLHALTEFIHVAIGSHTKKLQIIFRMSCLISISYFN